MHNSHIKNIVNILKCVKCGYEKIFFLGDHLKCKKCKKKYNIIEGVPILLVDNFSFIKKNSKNLFEKKYNIENLCKKNSQGLYKYVCKFIPSTSGFLYKEKYLKNGFFKTYPIPIIDLPKAKPKRNKFLDLGCGWGRWVFSAAKKKYFAIGVDANINFLILANRIAKEKNYNSFFIMADIKKLPFKKESFDIVFSYSVIQHFSFVNISKILREVIPILKKRGVFKFQTMNFFGIRNQYYLLKKLYKKPQGFDVHYYSIKFMKKLLKSFFSFVKVENCSFFTQARSEDLSHFNFNGKILIFVTQIFNFIFRYFKNFSDNIYFICKKKA
ncbi:UbiE Methylase involved in ubiquinone/menaquinone biosynthesis [Candidatus Pelagibacterales bacterium]